MNYVDLDQVRELVKKYRQDIFRYYGLGHLEGKIEMSHLIDELKKEDLSVLNDLYGTANEVDKELEQERNGLDEKARYLAETLDKQASDIGETSEFLKKELDKVIKNLNELDRKREELRKFISSVYLAKRERPRW